MKECNESSMIINNQFMETEQTLLVETKVVRPDGTGGALIKEHLIKEHQIEVSINEKPVLRLVCTPNRLPELVLGRIVTEGLIKSRDDVESLYICENGRRARIYLKQGMELSERKEEPQTEPTCCTDNKLLGSFYAAKELCELPRAAYSDKSIFELIGKFHENSSLHRKTMGTHSCYLSYQGKYREVFEDIGRHNALDKAVGYALVNSFDLKDCMVFTTGRVPVDMVKKAVMAGIPVLVSKAVPTVEAVELARRFRLTLICRAWPDSYEVYNEGKIDV